MISFISGVVTEVDEGRIVLECTGLGYEIFCSGAVIDKMGSVGQRVTIFTHLLVREDGLTLYGFCSASEKSMFLKLISVSNVGAKVAMSILSGISLNDLYSCITTNDFARLSQIKGVGKKTAERLCLELKDKLGIDFELGSSPSVGLNQDAVLALVAMGFSKTEAQLKVQRVTKDGLSTEQIILNALKP